jgi:hypothetical protein
MSIGQIPSLPRYVVLRRPSVPMTMRHRRPSGMPKAVTMPPRCGGRYGSEGSPARPNRYGVGSASDGQNRLGLHPIVGAGRCRLVRRAPALP